MNNMLRIVVIMVSIFADTVPSLAQWAQTNGPFGGKVVSLFVSGTNVFAGNEVGVFLSMNNGESWSEPNLDLNPSLISSFVVMPNPEGGQYLFAGSQGQGIFLSTDNGSNWKKIDSGLTNKTVWALAFSGSNLFAGTSGGVFLSTNNGESWNAENNGLPNTSIYSIAVMGTNLFAGTCSDGVAGTSGRGVFLSTNNGISWVEHNSGLTYNDINVLAVSDTIVYAGTDGVFRSTKNDTTWTLIGQGGVGVTAFANNPNGQNGMNYFAASFGNACLISTDNGASWPDTLDINQSTRNTILSLAVCGPNLLAGTRLTGVFLSTDNGFSWRQSNSGMTVHINCIAIIDSTLFAGANGGLYSSTDDGATWSINTFVPSAAAFAVSSPANRDSAVNFFEAT
jgi:hypothetical protein